MDATLKKVIALLDPAHPAEVRQSAILVVTELAPDDSKAHAAIEAALDDADALVRIRAIHAVGRLKIQPALPWLLGRVETGGEGASDAANAAAKLGARAAKSLQDLMPKVAPGLRRYIASALGAAGTASADAAAIEFLLDTDPGVVNSAVRSLLAQVPTLSPAKKLSLAEQLLHLFKDAKTGLPIESEAAAVRLLAALHDKRGIPIFWARCDKTHPAEIRVAALQALGGLGEKPTSDQLARLIACAAEERDFRIVAPALLMLQHLSATAKTAPQWQKLLRAVDPAARQLGLEKLDGFDTPELAADLVESIHHPDAAFREAVRARLGSTANGQAALQSALLEAENVDAAWSLARAMTSSMKSAPKPLRDKIFTHASKLLEAGDRLADPFLFFLRETDAADVRDRLAEKAIALRKKKDYDGAMTYLKLLARDPALGFDNRFEVAAVGLKVSNKELALRANDPCLGHFTHLVQGYEAELLKALDKAKWLEPEDLYYLGFHFAEKDGGLRKFGGAVLAMLVKKSPKSKIAKDARTKIKASGL